MPTRQVSRSLKATFGVALAAVGLLLLFVNLDNATADLTRHFVPPAQTLGALLDLGLAGLRAAQTYFFDHASFQSGLYQILISFWPLTLVFFGAAMLQNAMSGRLASARNGLRSRANGVHE